MFYVPHYKQKNFIKHFKNLINVPFKFTSEGSNIMFNNFNNYVFQNKNYVSVASLSSQCALFVRTGASKMWLFAKCAYFQSADFVQIFGEMCRFFVCKFVQISVAAGKMHTSAALQANRVTYLSCSIYQRPVLLLFARQHCSGLFVEFRSYLGNKNLHNVISKKSAQTLHILKICTKSAHFGNLHIS